MFEIEGFEITKEGKWFRVKCLTCKIEKILDKRSVEARIRRGYKCYCQTFNDFLAENGLILTSSLPSNCYDKIKVKCIKCGYEFVSDPTSLHVKKKGNCRKGAKLCTLCAHPDKLITFDRITAWLASYMFATDLTKYKNEDSILSFTCLKCNNTTTTKFCRIVETPSCSFCRNMRGWYFNSRDLLMSYFTNITLHSGCEILADGSVVSISNICRLLNITPFDLYKYAVLAKNERKPGERNDRVYHHVRCDRGHEFYTNERYLREGHGCAECSTSFINFPERMLIEFVTSLGFTIDSRNRSILNGRELDIVIQEKKIAIEYVGTKWHSLEYNKHESRYAKQKKTIDCHSLDYRLLTIFESDFMHKRDETFLKIKSILSGVETDTLDLRWAPCCGRHTEPRLRFFTRQHKEVQEKPYYFSVYDCGENAL